MQTFSALQLYQKRNPTPISNNIWEGPTASPIWNMAYKFTITWSFSFTLHNLKQILRIIFIFHSVKLIASSSDNEPGSEHILVKILVLFILMSSMISDKKKGQASWTFFHSCKWSKDMWHCATTNIAHDQGSYLTEARLTFTEWRSASKLAVHYICKL